MTQAVSQKKKKPDTLQHLMTQRTRRRRNLLVQPNLDVNRRQFKDARGFNKAHTLNMALLQRGRHTHTGGKKNQPSRYEHSS